MIEQERLPLSAPPLESAVLAHPLGIAPFRGAVESQLLLDQLQVAKRLQCSVHTVVRLRRTGQLAFVRIGNRLVRFREEDLADYLAASRKLSAVA